MGACKSKQNKVHAEYNADEEKPNWAKDNPIANPFSTLEQNMSRPDSTPPNPAIMSKIKRYSSDTTGYSRLRRHHSNHSTASSRHGQSKLRRTKSRGYERSRERTKEFVGKSAAEAKAARLTPLEIRAAVMKDARGRATGRITPKGEWLGSANKALATFGSDGSITAGPGKLVGHISDDGMVTTVHNSRTIRVGEVGLDGTVRDTCTTVGHVTADGVAFDMAGRKVGSCDAGSDISAVVHFFGPQLQRAATASHTHSHSHHGHGHGHKDSHKR